MTPSEKTAVQIIGRLQQTPSGRMSARMMAILLGLQQWTVLEVVRAELSGSVEIRPDGQLALVRPKAPEAPSTGPEVRREETRAPRPRPSTTLAPEEHAPPSTTRRTAPESVQDKTFAECLPEGLRDKLRW